VSAYAETEPTALALGAGAAGAGADDSVEPSAAAGASLAPFMAVALACAGAPGATLTFVESAGAMAAFSGAFGVDPFLFEAVAGGLRRFL